MFDASKARGPKQGPDVGEEFTRDVPPEPAAAPISVSALITQIKGALSDAFPQQVYVVGELSNVKLHTSGHLYFRLKDARAAIDAAMFRQHASRLRFRASDGLEVVVQGRVDVYDVRGQLQLYVESMTPKGMGALELAFRQLVEKLRAEGLFDPERKKPIPRFPGAVGVITSPTGAAIRDIRRTLARRWGGIAVYLVPVLVQGEGAAKEIAQGIRLLDANAPRYQIDTIIVARGGGSLEDLWAFNEEIVARAIFAAKTPIISGVGHEVDVTIADYVADMRAPTPTGAAELAVPDAAEVRTQVLQLGRRLRNLLEDDLKGAQSALDAVLRSVVFRDPTARVRTQTQRVDELAHRLRAGANQMLARDRKMLAPAESRLAGVHPGRLYERAVGQLDRATSRLAWVLGARTKHAADQLALLKERLSAVHPRHRLHLVKQQVAAAGRQLAAMSYRSVLRRGYSVTRSDEGKILRTVVDVTEGDRIETELFDGSMTSKVHEKKRAKPDQKGSPEQRASRKTDSPSTPKRKGDAGESQPERSLFD